MSHSIRQKKVASLIREEMSQLFQRNNISTYQGGMVTITNLSMTPDLMIARIHISLFNIKDKEALMTELKEQKNELRKRLGNKIKTQVRRIPELEFFIDDSLDEVFRLEEIFKQIKK